VTQSTQQIPDGDRTDLPAPSSAAARGEPPPNSLLLLQNDPRESYVRLRVSPATEKPPVCSMALRSGAGNPAPACDAARKGQASSLTSGFSPPLCIHLRWSVRKAGGQAGYN